MEHGSSYESYLAVLEDNHWVMVKSVDPEVFLDYLHQHRVLSEDDCQVIQNYYVNTSRRARMSCFLKILRTKGPENVHVFLEQLGWEYPHVYREIFRREPQPPPASYEQNTRSRLSCDLNQLLTVGLDMRRMRNQREALADQVKDMELMLKHQKNEIEDLERENQRLRQYERDHQQSEERNRTLNTKNEEIKEENRQFLHEIRTLTIEVQKRRDQEAALQSRLDEMSEQIQEKSFELNRKSREESDLRAKYEHVRKESLRFQSHREARNRQTNLGSLIAMAQHTAMQNDLKQQMEILMDDMKGMEDTNRDLCEKMEYVQDLLNLEKKERDQLYQQLCALEHEKNMLKSRQMTAGQKIERYFSKIKELEEQKRKLEEERIHMQTKAWEMSQASERLFDQLHKAEARYDEVQQNFEQFRQDHRTCVPGDREPFARVRSRVRPVKDVDYQGGPSRILPPITGNGDPFAKLFTPYSAASHEEDSASNNTDTMASDGNTSPVYVHNPLSDLPTGRGLADRPESMQVNPSASMKRRDNSQDQDDHPNSEEDVASTLSDVSSVSSSAFDQLDISCIGSTDSDQVSPRSTQNGSSDGAVTGNFFVRANTSQDEGDGKIAVQEGDILYVVQKDKELWDVMAVDKRSGKIFMEQKGTIPNPDSTSKIRRNPSTDSTGRSSREKMERQNAIRGLRRQHSSINCFSSVLPMKASRLLPVLLLCPPSIMQSVLSCMETTAKDWAEIIPEDHCQSSTQLFQESLKHNVLPWEIRPKVPEKYNNNLHKFIIIVITLQSREALPTLRHLLGEPDLTMDFDKETAHLKEQQDMVQHAGLHFETVTVVAGQDDREALWTELKDKVDKLQNQVFWLESYPH